MQGGLLTNQLNYMIKMTKVRMYCIVHNGICINAHNNGTPFLLSVIENWKIFAPSLLELSSVYQ